MKNLVNEAQMNFSPGMNPRDEIALNHILRFGGLENSDFGKWIKANIIKEVARSYNKDFYQTLYTGNDEEIKNFRTLFPSGCYSIDEEFIERADKAIQNSTLISETDREDLFQALLCQWKHHRFSRQFDSRGINYQTHIGSVGEIEQTRVWEDYLTHPRGQNTHNIFNRWAGRDENRTLSVLHPLLRFGIFGISQLIQEEFETNPWPEIAQRIVNPTGKREDNRTEVASTESVTGTPENPFAEMPVKRKAASKWFMREKWLPEMEKRFQGDPELKEATGIDPDTLNEYRKERKKNSDKKE